jgi:spore coat protein CotH
MAADTDLTAADTPAPTGRTVRPLDKVRHKIPVRLRHQWRVVALACAVLVVLAGVLGAYRVRPLVLSDTADKQNTVKQDIAGLVDIFDHSVGHTITVTFKNKDYDRMIEDFRKDGEKNYVEADMTIDGTSLPSVGIRLKGNSTLQSLRRSAGGGGGPAGGFGGGFGTALSTEEPENLPWLVSFDKYVDGRVYQGREEIAIRPAGSSTLALNESLSLSLIGLTGEPTQAYAYTSFTVNDRPATIRLLIEHPDKHYANSLGDNGVLYKSLAGSQFTYQGEDPTEYADDFDQINRKGSQDLQPVVDLIRWVQQSSDADFTAGLAARVEVESFARYVALQNLLLNFDDMSGPGKNYFLWYDLSTRKFTVVTWDMNLSFSGDASQGPYDAGRMGGRGGGGPVIIQGGPAPGGAVPGGPVPGGAVAGGAGAGMRAGNALKERFLANAEFKKVYEAAYRQVYRTLFTEGRALRALSHASASLLATGADASTVETEAQRLRTIIEQRTQSLATNAVITNS